MARTATPIIEAAPLTVAEGVSVIVTGVVPTPPPTLTVIAEPVVPGQPVHLHGANLDGATIAHIRKKVT